MWARLAWVLALSVVLHGSGCAPVESTAVQRPEQRLVLLHTSDLHSRVWPFWERIAGFEAELGLGRAGALEQVAGFARLASVLQRERRAGALVWLDSGDALEGAEVFHRFRGKVELELLAELGLSAMALGNHELSLPAPELSAWLRSAPFPVLAANLEPEQASPLKGLLHPSALVRADGLALGIVGVAHPRSPPDLASPGNAWGLAALADTAAAVQAAIDAVAPRADLVVLLSHLGLEADRDLVRATSGAQLVLGGHQHFVTQQWQDDCLAGAVRETRGCISRAVPIVHSGAYGKLVSRIELEVEASSSGWQVTGVTLSRLPLATSVPEEPVVLARLAQLAPPVAQPLGFAPRPIPRRSALGADSPLGNLIADAVARATGADAVLLNGSALRGDLEAGLLLEADLELAWPFAEPWLLARVSGARLRRGLLGSARRAAERGCEAAVQIAGLRVSVDCASCRAGSSGCLAVSRRDLFGERPLSDAELLLVALPAYLTRQGADFADLRGEALDLSVPALLADHVRHLPGSADSRACVAALAGLANARCLQAFGQLGCPVDAQRADGWCRTWPWVIGGSDGRIEMLP